MAINCSDSSKYISPSTGEYCTSAQYIAEILVTREASKEQKNLPYKFWNSPPWDKKFRSQVTEAYKILKKYHPIPVIRAINKINWAYSLRTKQLKTAIEEEIAKYEQECKSESEIQVTTTTYTPKKVTGKSIIGKLND